MKWPPPVHKQLAEAEGFRTSAQCTTGIHEACLKRYIVWIVTGDRGQGYESPWPCRCECHGYRVFHSADEIRDAAAAERSK